MQQAYDQLELPSVRQALKVRCKSALGIEKSTELGPLRDRNAAVTSVNQISQMRLRLEAEAPPPLSGASNVELDLEQATKQMVLEGPQLLAVAKTMDTIARLRNYLLPLDTIAPLLFGLGASLEELQKPAQKILHSFEPSGRLADDASADLGPLRKRMRAIEDSVQETLRSLMESSNIKKILQEPYFTLRADRYVLPVISSFKGKLEGIVHDASSTGQTVFIEPQRIVQLGNRLKIAQSEVKEEEFRILSVLSSIVGRHAYDVRHGMEVVGQVDLLTASAQLSIDLDCNAIVPATNPCIKLVDARHPLLILQKLEDPSLPLVGNDISLEEEQRVLILTGPNTGGKTVAMKTVGLFALMLRSGLHLPCDARSELGWFRYIDVAMGDQQSIESKLSTFAAHIKALGQIVDRANHKDLVLIDEIAADTDPTQGQALGHAVLEALADKSSHVVVTTHFEGLKAIPFANPKFRNAGVGFDASAFRPTYQVTLDVPQSSNGFDIAHSLGMNSEVINRARELCGSDSNAIEDLMKALENRANELREAKAQADKTARDFRISQAKLEEQRQALEKERVEMKEQAHDDLFEDIKAGRATVRKIISDLQKTVGDDAVRNAMRKANKVSQELRAIDEEISTTLSEKEEQQKHPQPLEKIEVGSQVYVPKIGQDGTVVSIDKKGALIAIGNMRLRSALNALEKPKFTQKKETLSTKKRIASHAPKFSAVAAVSSSEEIDLRGLNSDEAIARLDAFLDHHYQGPSDHIRIIHGHGTGVLKKTLRDHLKRSGYVRNFRAEDEKQGGDGATLVELS